MAGNGDDFQTSNKTVLYILPQRIQKRRYQDLKAAACKRKLHVSEEFCARVTHIVSEFDNRDQVIRCLKLNSGTWREEEVEIVSMTWFVDCMKAGHAVLVLEDHRLKPEPKESKDDERSQSEKKLTVAEWACQRVTCLTHHNDRFTKALEILERHAELRDSDQDYSRALAFRRASAVLKSLPFTVTSMTQLKDVKDLGGHSKKVVKDILEEGGSEEVEKISQDNWFYKMKEFTSVFGIGPSTAKKWIEKGWTSVPEARKHIETFHDWRIIWGLAFHEDLITPVTQHEAQTILSIVKCEAEKLLPGVIVSLTGGFRRGKLMGHDVDLLITHSEEGKELGLLVDLLRKLEGCGMILCGNLERSTFSDEVLGKDFKISARGQLDHFEKWLGMIKLPKPCRQESGPSNPAPNPLSGNDLNENAEKAVVDVATGNIRESDKSSSEHSADGSLDDHASSAKRRKVLAEGFASIELADSRRDWRARRVDLIIAPHSQYFYALVGWTGNKHFNRDLRLYATRKFNMKLTSHGMYDKTQNCSVPAHSEKAVFDNLQLDYKEPWQRNC